MVDFTGGRNFIVGHIITACASPISQHHHLDRAVKIHSEKLGHELNVGGQWGVIWELAQKAGNEKEFLNYLRASGLSSRLEYDSAAQKSGETIKQGADKIGQPLDDGEYDEDLGSKSEEHQKVVELTDQVEQLQEELRQARAAAREAIKPKVMIDDPTTRPMNGNPPPMSVALAKKQALNNTVIVTWANHALYDFVLNWVKHVRDAGES